MLGMGLTERLKVVETKTMKWTLTVVFEDHSTPPSLLIMSRGGRKERTWSYTGHQATCFSLWQGRELLVINWHLQYIHTSVPWSCCQGATRKLMKTCKSGLGQRVSQKSMRVVIEWVLYMHLSAEWVIQKVLSLYRWGGSRIIYS